MEKQKLHILSVDNVTRDVKRFRFKKPTGLTYESGQATEIFIDREGWRDEGRPFTFTSLPEDDILEFMIKRYPSHEGVTDELHKLEEGDTVLMNDVFGAIHYRGKGLFIAGGAGITPFISILRNLKAKGELDGNRLLFANKTSRDIILEKELDGMLGDSFVNILSEEEDERYLSGYITPELIADYIADPGDMIYVCGPPLMMDAVLEYLSDLGVPDDHMVTEED